jgi:hypothetical protein
MRIILLFMNRFHAARYVESTLNTERLTDRLQWRESRLKLAESGKVA